MYLPTPILRMPWETTEKTFRPFLGDRLSYGIHIPFIPLVRWFKTLGIIRVRRSLGLPNAFTFSSVGSAPMKFKDATLGRLSEGSDRHFS